MLENVPKKHGAEEAILDMCQLWRDLVPPGCQLASPPVFVGGSFLTFKKIKAWTRPVVFKSEQLCFFLIYYWSCVKRKCK